MVESDSMLSLCGQGTARVIYSAGRPKPASVGDRGACPRRDRNRKGEAIGGEGREDIDIVTLGQMMAL